MTTNLEQYKKLRSDKLYEYMNTHLKLDTIRMEINHLDELITEELIKQQLEEQKT